MSDKVAIVGAGHAGVAAAAVLKAAGLAVDLFTAEDTLPYFRPRLIAVAFGQAEPDAIAIKPASFYADGINLIHRTVTSPDELKDYAGVILTQGSVPFVPPFEGDRARLHTLWNVQDAMRIRAEIRPGARLTVIGGGVLGLESALRAAMAGLKVTVIESFALAGGVLGPACSKVLEKTLEAKGITLRVGACVAKIEANGIRLGDGTLVEDDLLLCSTGARGVTALGEALGAKADCGLLTNPDLSFAPMRYAAGDLARPTEARPVCAVRRATAMGTLAAQNLLAEREGRPTTPWTDPALPLFMKVEDTEFHTFGCCRGDSLDERRIDDGSKDGVIQTILYSANHPVGLRFVGTRDGFGAWEKQILA